MANVCVSSKIHAECLIDRGLIDMIVKVLHSAHDSVFEQGAWAVGCLAAHDALFKDVMLKDDILERLAARILSTSDQDILKITSWALCNLISGCSKHVNKCIAVTALIKLVTTQHDIDILHDSLDAILDMIDDSVVDELMDGRLAPVLVGMLRSSIPYIKYAILQILMHITDTADEHTQAVIDCDGISVIFDMLSLYEIDDKCRVSCLCIVSNVLVGSNRHISYVFDKNGWIDVIFDHCEHDSADVKSEAINCICNATKNADDNHMHTMIDKGILEVFVINLDLHCDDAVIRAILDSLSYILDTTEIITQVSLPHRLHMRMEAAGIIDRLEHLQYHACTNIYIATTSLIETHFIVNDAL